MTDPRRPTLISSLPARAFDLGCFFLEWRVSEAGLGALHIRHARRPDRVLFETRPGAAFVHAARGEARVREARGFFHVEDRPLASARTQTVDGFEREGDEVVISGRILDGLDAAWRIRFGVVDAEQLALELELSGPEASSINRVGLRHLRPSDERIFGFGAQFTELDMAGRRVPVLSQEPGIGRGVQPLTFLMNTLFGAGGTWHNSNAPVPYYLTTAGRAFALEHSEYSVFDFRAPDAASVEVFAPRMSARILFGETPLDVIEVYTRHTGRMAPLPEWMESGAVIGMQGGTRAVERMLERLERFDTPIAAFWLQDWVGGRTTAIGRQLWWNWEVDRDTYPDWERLVERLASRGTRVLSYVNPFLVDPAEKGAVGRNLHAEASARGYFVQDREGRPYSILNTSFSANLLDLTNPDARRWMKDILREHVLASGASGWMADFGEALPFDAVLHDGSDPASAHNRYPVEWARLNREAIREAGREGDVVFFTRSGFTGSPRESTLFWLGDQLTSWRREDGIQSAVIALLSSGFSGFSLTHSDVGGYTATAIPAIPFDVPLVTFTRDKELLLRWIELNAFTAAFRTHEGNRPDRNHQIDADDETTAHFARFARVFAALGEYRRQLGIEAASRGHPVVRHPWLHFPEDPTAARLELQFMLGQDFLIAPVVERGATEVNVYLPRGRWVHLWTDREIVAPDGVWCRVPAPVGAPAVFFRAGSRAGARLVERLDQRGDRRLARAVDLPPVFGRPVDSTPLGPRVRAWAEAVARWSGRAIDALRRLEEKEPG